MFGTNEEEKNWVNLGEWARNDEECVEAVPQSNVLGVKSGQGKFRSVLSKQEQFMQKRQPIPLNTREKGIDKASEHRPGSEGSGNEASLAGVTQGEESRSLATSPSFQAVEFDEPGAFPVGEEDDGTTTIVVADDSDVSTTEEVPVTAELVDLEVEDRRVSQRVELEIRRARLKAPVAEVVNERCYQRRLALTTFFLLALVFLATMLAVFLSKEKGTPPAPVPPVDKVIEILSSVSSDKGVSLQTTGTPQNLALNWLTNDTFQGYHTDEKLLQRYALATLYFATNGESWFNNTMWLDSGDECDRWWQLIGGLSCESPTGGLTSLGLPKNNLSGSLPPEVFILTSLEGLSLSQNDFRSTIPSEIGNLVG